MLIKLQASTISIEGIWMEWETVIEHGRIIDLRCGALDGVEGQECLEGCVGTLDLAAGLVGKQIPNHHLGVKLI